MVVAPGTGKSVVSLWRHIQNIEQRHKSSLLLCYTKTLEYYLRNALSVHSDNAARSVDRIYRWTYNDPRKRYDEIIIDEAQDAPIEKYFIIRRLSDTVCFGADNQQQLFPDKGTSRENLKGFFNIINNDITTKQL